MFRRLLVALALVLVAGSASAQFQDNLDPFAKGAVCAPCATIKNNIVGYWKLEEASGTRVDASGNGQDLTATNTPGNTAGVSGNGLQCVGASSQFAAKAAGFTALSEASDYTIALWIKSGGSQGTVNWIVSNVGQNSPDIRQSGTGILFQGTGFDIGIGVLTTGTWTFVAARYNHTTFLGEAKINNGAWLTLTGTSPTPVGTGVCLCARNSAGRFYTGSLDEVGIWSRRLNDGEVTYEYNAGSGRTLYAWLELWFPGLRNFAEMDWRLWLSSDDLRLAAA